MDTKRVTGITERIAIIIANLTSRNPGISRVQGTGNGKGGCNCVGGSTLK